MTSGHAPELQHVRELARQRRVRDRIDRLMATEDLDGIYERVQASGAEVVQEPMAQDYGLRDCAFRDPAGNLVRIQERR